MIKKTGSVTITKDETKIEGFTFDCSDHENAQREAMRWAANILEANLYVIRKNKKTNITCLILFVVSLSFEIAGAVFSFMNLSFAALCWAFGAVWYGLYLNEKKQDK